MKATPIGRNANQRCMFFEKLDCWKLQWATNLLSYWMEESTFYTTLPHKSCSCVQEERKKVSMCMEHQAISKKWAVAWSHGIRPSHSVGVPCILKVSADHDSVSFANMGVFRTLWQLNFSSDSATSDGGYSENYKGFVEELGSFGMDQWLLALTIFLRLSWPVGSRKLAMDLTLRSSTKKKRFTPDIDVSSRPSANHRQKTCTKSGIVNFNL